MEKIIDAVSDNTSGEVESTYIQLYGGPKTMIASATAWGGATVTFRASYDGTNWYDLLDGDSTVTINANGVIVIPALAAGLKLGCKISGGTAINSITVQAI